MDIKKDYFPTAKAPDIAKKKIMQYIYWNKKNLSKRFYFYRVYAPAFLLLFIVWGWFAFYNKANKPDWQIYTLKTDSWISRDIIDEPKAADNVAGKIETLAINDNVWGAENLNNNINKANLDVVTSKAIQKDTNQNASAATYASNNSQVTLNQQINELEILMNDISSITVQEEILF